MIDGRSRSWPASRSNQSLAASPVLRRGKAIRRPSGASSTCSPIRRVSTISALPWRTSTRCIQRYKLLVWRLAALPRTNPRAPGWSVPRIQMATTLSAARSFRSPVPAPCDVVVVREGLSRLLDRSPWSPPSIHRGSPPFRFRLTLQSYLTITSAWASTVASSVAGWSQPRRDSRDGLRGLNATSPIC
jgi:hypothetical protein